MARAENLAFYIRCDKEAKRMDKRQEQILMLMLMDLVDHDLLTVEEAESAKRIYIKNECSKEKRVINQTAA